MEAMATPLFRPAGFYRHLTTRYDASHGALWFFLFPAHKACFSFEVLDDLRRFQRSLEILAERGGDERDRLRYVIMASQTPGVFNYGGDLSLFSRCVKEGDADTLRKYARACIDVLYPHSVGYHLPVTTISLVQGDALGGGFEAALASDVIIAERSSRMGFPEVLFNLFPGMGAYNLLHRKIGMTQTERMILSGKAYRAEDLYARGVVDILADDGNGEKALYEHIVRLAGKDRSSAAIHQVRRRLCPVRYEQLLEVVEIWVDTALRMGPRQLRMMEKLVRAQERVAVPAPASASGNGGVPPL
jgi:DSF synthase